MLNTNTPVRRAQKFPGAASFRISLSRVRSATAFLSRWFSYPSSLRRFTWSVFSPPNSLRQRKSGYLRHANRADRFRHGLALRGQHINLLKLGNNLI